MHPIIELTQHLGFRARPTGWFHNLILPVSLSLSHETSIHPPSLLYLERSYIELIMVSASWLPSRHHPEVSHLRRKVYKPCLRLSHLLPALHLPITYYLARDISHLDLSPHHSQSSCLLTAPTPSSQSVTVSCRSLERSCAVFLVRQSHFLLVWPKSLTCRAPRCSEGAGW